MSTVSSRSLVMTQSTSPFIATSLNKSTLKGTFLMIFWQRALAQGNPTKRIIKLELDNDAMLEPFVVPIDRIKMNIAIFCAQTDQAVGFECGVEGQSQTVNQLQVLPGAIPTIKQHRLGLNLFGADRSQQQLLKMVVL